VGDPRALVLGRRAAIELPSAVEPRRGARWAAHWQIGAVFSATALVAVTALQAASGNGRGLPVAPVAPSLRVVATAYVPAPVPPLPVADATPPWPLSVPPQLPAVVHAAKPLAPPAAKSPAPHVQVKPQADAIEPARPAVVLDEADTSLHGTAPATLAQPAKGLIAITPDNKLAVFTDPGTGLPQQFHIGDPLPGGDTLRAIDGRQGKVFTSAREYSLD